MRVLFAALLLAPLLAWPCAIADPGSLRTHAAEEEALIVFDEAAGIEHFIRGVEFYAEGDSFGFIVPTPSEPTFGEFDSNVFEDLVHAYEAIRPRTTTWGCGSAFVFKKLGGPMRAGSVNVLRRERVNGMDVTVVKSDDATALAQWLTRNGFELREPLKNWLDVYVKQGWVFSAFRYEGKPHGTLTSKATRISFATKTPIYPYREPADSERFGGLRVWLVSREAREWKGGTPAEVLLRTSKLTFPASIDALLPGPKVVTVFDDSTTKRPDEDVRFEPAAGAAEFIIPHEDHADVPMELGCCVFALFSVMVVVRRLARRPRASGDAPPR
ncbi:MAG: DUF2330 domain-containing protein [Archangium sp.]